MKILLIIPVFYAQSGGTVKVVQSLAKELAKKHDVTVFTTSAFDNKHDLMKIPCKVKINGYSIIYFPRINFLPFFCISPTMCLAIKNTLQHYDIIHVHSWRQFPDMIIHYYATKYNVPYLINTHGSLHRIITKKWLKLIYDLIVGYRVLYDASKVVASNEVEAKDIELWGISRKNIAIIPNGIDLCEYEIIPSKGLFKRTYFIKPEEKIILYVGRIHESKGLDLLAQAFSIINKKSSNIKLVLIGPDDGYKPALLKLMSDLDILNQSIFTGFVSKEMKLAALVDSDVFVTPKFNSFPTAFLEACLMGCPIITTTKDLDWIDNNIGFVTKESPDEISQGISQIISNNELQTFFKNNAKYTIQKFTISTIVKQLESFYRQALCR